MIAHGLQGATQNVRVIVQAIVGAWTTSTLACPTGLAAVPPVIKPASHSLSFAARLPQARAFGTRDRLAVRKVASGSPC
jgi:hypothetical protein